MKRIFDFVLSFNLLIILMLPILLIFVFTRGTSNGPAIFWSDRIGKDNKLFKMPKFRTMYVNTPNVATHLLENSEKYITPFGFFLRRYSLDELPQIWTIFIGKMSFVGPRPALYNQYDLIDLRAKKGVNKILPGLTGLAQINGRDNLSIKEKVKMDYEYLKQRSLYLDMKIIFKTFLTTIKKTDISH